MLHKTKGIVLRSVKYGETSLVTTIFTALFGIQAYMLKGVRSARQQNKAGYFQAGMLLDLVVYHHPEKKIHSISQFQSAYAYQALQEDVVRNSVVIFAAELLLRLLPENAPAPDLFTFSYHYFVQIDQAEPGNMGNYPIYYLIRCAQEAGFEFKGNHNELTPYADMTEGEFTALEPGDAARLTVDEARALDVLLRAKDYMALHQIKLPRETRHRLLDWYIAFLQLHSQHLGNIRSVAVLRTILH